MIHVEHFEKLDDSKKGGNFLKEVVDRIFVISKNDPTFKNKNELKDLENNIKIINNKIKKQDNLLKQSEKIEKDITKRNMMIDADIDGLRNDLLESLGSEM